MHYRRWKKSGDAGGAASYRNAKNCSVDGCDAKHLAKGYCKVHYQRWITSGDPGPAHLLKAANQAWCLAENCEKPARSRHLCHKHYKRWQVFGETGIERISERDSSHTISYRGAHRRVEAAFGSARMQSCVECGESALEWSYDHEDPEEVLDERGIPYSVTPSFYRPMCISCHRNFDLAHIKEATHKLSQSAVASSISKE